ncbi:MAG: 30S ribosomal protein S3 [Candidatus Asgardarchaeia archaeon]
MKAKQHFLSRGILKMSLDEYLENELARAGYGGVNLIKTPLGTRVVVKAARPGLVIGRHGKTVRELTEKLQELFGIENPQIEVEEITTPELNARVMAARLASALQRGIHFRRAGYSVLRRIMGAGAKGVEIIISGKLTGQRAKYQKFRAGMILKAGDPAMKYVDEATTSVVLKPGVLGVTVRIMKPDAELPDVVEIIEGVELEEGEIPQKEMSEVNKEKSSESE